MATMQQLVDRALESKAAQRTAARAKSWAEKIATIERLRDATKLARQSMQARKLAK